MGVGPRPKPLVQPVTKTMPNGGALLPGQRIDFNSLPIPAGYVPGVGRGAAGFVTRSDIGSVRTAPRAPPQQGRPGQVPSTAPGAPPPGSSTAPGAPAPPSSSRPFDKFLGDDEGALNVPPQDADDVEADAIWDSVDARMEERRKAGAASSSSAAGKKRPAGGEAAAEASSAAGTSTPASSTNNIADGFADLKRGLAAVTEAEWEAIPEIGDYTIKKAKRDTWAPVPDTLLAKAAAEMASTSTTVVEGGASAAGGSSSALPDGSAASLAPGGSLTAVGEGRRTVVSLKLDSAADSVSGQTVVDPRGYLTSLSSQRISSAAEVGDIKKARTLLRSVTATNPRHAPGWVAAARLEEVAGKLADARALAAKGCELCPRSEDVWLEASRLAATAGDSKAALARAVGALPRSVRLWLAAAELEQERAAKARVVRHALERVPASLKLWKAAVELAPTEDDARVLLARAVECCPQHVELWLALARLETHEGARKVLNRARLAVPTDASIWVTASKLEEAHGKTEMVPKIVERAVKSLRANSVVIDREAWIKDAEEAEKSGSPATARAMVSAVVSLGVEDADRERTWLADASDLSKRGSFACAREVAAAALAAFPGKPGVWRAAVAVEKAAAAAAAASAGGAGEGEGEKVAAAAEAAAAVDALLQKAVSYCPDAEVLWLMAAKEKWSLGDVPAARRLLADAFSANPDSEAIWLAAFKLEFESGEIERARAILKKARSTSAAAAENGSSDVAGGDTPRVWMKAAVVERRAGDVAAERLLLDQAVKRFPTFAKLHLMRGQLGEREGDWPGARRSYAAGLARCPGSAPLWISAARLEERAAAAAAASASTNGGGGDSAGASRARALLEQARLRNPDDDELWLAAVRTEARAAGLWARARDAGVSSSGAAAAGLSGAAASLLAKALQACPHSGRLWAEAISTAPRPSRRSTSVDALKKCNDDPHVVSAVATLFAADRKPEKARSWYERAVRLDPDCGDHWARYYLFEKEQGGNASAEAAAAAARAVLARCVAAAPRHGKRWTRIAKDPKLEHLKTAELLPLVAEDVANEPPP